MTARLREEMRASAEGVTPYELYAGALAKARRHRRRQWVAAATAAAILALLAIVAPPLTRPAPAPVAPVDPSVPPTPSLPAKIGAPLWGTPDVTDEPIGPASVAFGSGLWWWGESKGVTALVGASTDAYGTVQNRDVLRAGEHVLLSPDGALVATENRVIDLRTGKDTTLPDLGATPRIPQAWSADGRYLAVVAYKVMWVTEPNGGQTYGAAEATLHLVEVATGQHRKIADLPTRGNHDGWTAAFAPAGGARLAYQSGTQISVVSLDGTLLSRFDMDLGVRLAGKGAWTRDGEGLMLLRQRRCCAKDAYQSRWQLFAVDAATGRDRAEPAVPELAGLVAVRLLGWTNSGEPVITAAYPEPGIAVVGFDTDDRALSISGNHLADYAFVRSARVVALAADGTQRVLVRGPDEDVLSIDVSEAAIASGLTRPGRAPTGLGPYLRRALVALAVGAVLVLTAVILLVIHIGGRRRRRPRYPISRPYPPPR
ncbi:hypothetical protein [Dactylosporangium salmoneum]|uniref:WD40 repeat domain-containing protein n=1 Tax=Dactylosporangium salmoneum TaxID=53361 RepID=A0ABP5SD52_9ACTN